MSKMLLVAHGDLPAAFRDLIGKVLGENILDRISCISLDLDHDTFDDFRAKIDFVLTRNINKYPKDQILILSDFMGGIPEKAARASATKLIKEKKLDKNQIIVMTGFNIPLLLELSLDLGNKENFDSNYIQEILKNARESLKNIELF